MKPRFAIWSAQTWKSGRTRTNADAKRPLIAEFERAMIRERILSGLARTRAQGTKLGRKRLEDADADKVQRVLDMRANGAGIRKIARDLGVGVGTVIRLTREVTT